METTINYLHCEHMTEKEARDMYDMFALNSRHRLSSTCILVLCNECKKIVAYDLITMFNRDSSPLPTVSYGHRF